jgi:hypothetical protein
VPTVSVRRSRGEALPGVKGLPLTASDPRLADTFVDLLGDFEHPVPSC